MVVQMHVSQPYLHRSEAVNIELMRKQVKILVQYAHT